MCVNVSRAADILDPRAKEISRGGWRPRFFKKFFRKSHVFYPPPSFSSGAPNIFDGGVHGRDSDSSSCKVLNKLRLGLPLIKK